jgi:acetoacetyl-CoA reductase
MKQLAIITGGVRGIGAAISISLKNHGYEVIASYRNNHEIAKQFSTKYNIRTLAWDVTKWEECQDAVKAIEQEYGQAISILVNNAGIIDDSMMHKMAAKKWHEVIDANLNSCFNMCNAVINGMRAQQFGRIVNVTSVNAQLGQFGQTNYSAAKAGMIGFTKALARESAIKNITVNCIAPGYIDTDMIKAIAPEILNDIVQNIPVKRLGTPEDVARAALFLVDKQAGFITGETLSINGGYYMV